ncbi:MAG: hypothetical protein AABY65_07110 [Nitrospirota bacterium]
MLTLFRLPVLPMLAALAFVILSACAPPPPPGDPLLHRGHPPFPGAMWAPGHYGPGGKWVPGHWKKP